jgi:alpha-tubulin suppressor-like RCC1 family protein
MPFISAGDGDLKSAFITDAWLIDQFVGNRLFTWGDNTFGQLGDNTTIHRSNPVQTVAGGTNWSQVACGLNFTAAIKTDCTLWSWGTNVIFGNLGDNTTINRSSPVQITGGGNNWQQISAVYTNAAAIKTDGTLWLWGDNGAGQLGDNTTISRSSPVQTVSRGNNWRQVACGYSCTAAIKTDGTLWCWGYNYNGQLGDNTTTSRSSPVQTIVAGNNWKSAFAAYHVAAIKTDGTLWLWGANFSGQLGDNTQVDKSSPIQTISGGSNWKQMGTGGQDNMGAIKTDGTLWLWGYNGYGGLGTNNTIATSSPIQTVTGGTNWKQLGIGAGIHVGAVKTDGSLWVWGGVYSLSMNGLIGDNANIYRSSPVQTSAGGYNWKQVSAGYTHTAAVTYGD